MKSAQRFIAAVACAALLAGCATQQQRIEKRIGQKAAFFATLPANNQQRLREGVLVSGDAPEAAWIVYGPPDRVFSRVTGTTTNEVWSYIAYEPGTVDTLRPVYHPVRTSRGRTLWRHDYLWATDTYHNPYEYLRIEFQDNRILALETEKQ